MLKKMLVILLILTAIPLFVFGQSVGKIAGVAKDKSTGEPLPGVNIIVEGTATGSATDIDGYFVILNVPVGVYTLRASYIGYKDIVMSNIRVSAGITTEANFNLEPTTLELEEAVVVTAERPLVEKNVTQSQSLLTSEEIENIPIRGFENIMSTQKGVIVQDRDVHIRGGRADEVGFYLDGANTTNVMANDGATTRPEGGNLVTVIQEAVEEFQVLAGGYGAEFGSANSGIIRTELKTGSSDLHFSLDLQTDKFAKEGKKFLGTYSYQHHIGVATLSGPLFSNKVRFFVAGENNYQGDNKVRFSEGFNTQTDLPDGVQIPYMVDTNPERKRAAGDTVEVIAYPDGWTPGNRYDRWAFNGTLLFDFSPLKFRVSGAYTKAQTNWDGAPMLSVLNNREAYIDFNSMLLSGKLTWVINPTTFGDLAVGYFNSKRERKDDYFGNQWWKWEDSLAVANYTRDKFGAENEVEYATRWRPQEPYLLNGIYFQREGNPVSHMEGAGTVLGYWIEDQNYWSGSLNLVSQLGRHHEVKLGGDARIYTIRQFRIDPGVMSLFGKTGYDPNDPLATVERINVKTWLENGNLNSFGYDIYGNEADKDRFVPFQDTLQFQVADAPKKPVFAAIYLTDKIEYNDLIINAGLRWDYFDSKSRRLIDASNPNVDQNTKTILEDSWEDVKAYSYVSPRLGFSFPVSDRTVFYLQYGKFVQMPELETLYAGSSRYNYEYVSAGFSFQNPSGYGLEPVRTTSYEIGFRQQISGYAAFDLTGYYRNIKGQVQIERVTAVNPVITDYNILVNSDFVTTKGIEFSLNLRRVNRVQMTLNYTLTDAEGTGSNRTAHVAGIEQSTPRPSVIRPLDFSQTHTGAIILDYRFGRNDGGPILSQLGLNGIFSFSSGHPYTLAENLIGQVSSYTVGVDYMLDTRARLAQEAIGSSTTPWNFNLDLRLDKSFRIAKALQGTVYMRVVNLFNTKNVLNVYDATGAADDDGFFANPKSQSFIDGNGGENYVALYKAINLNNGQAYLDQLALELYGHPRQIFFGLKLSY